MKDSDQKQPSIVLKHYCKVCNRGFGCGGALGGHMRSHGVGGGDARVNPNPNPNHEDKFNSDLSCSRADQGSKHSYFLRKANRSYRTSHEDRDKERLSTRPASGSSDQRGKCTMDETLMLQPGSSSESEEEEEEDHKRIIMGKYKRRKSENYDSSEEEDLANCLVMLSNKSFIFSDKEENKAKEVEKGMFQCKACKKVFTSHQALGGHRASHKKVKGCYAARLSNPSNEENRNVEEDLINREEFLIPSDSLELDQDHSANLQTSSTISKGKSKEHECSICHRIFSSGQALGGHKRCHWLTTTTNLPDNTILQNLNDQFQFNHSPSFIFKKPMIRKPGINLDLNSPPILNINLDSDLNRQIQQNLTRTSYNNDRTGTTPIFDYEAPARIFLQLWGGGGVDNIGINHNQKVEKINDTLHDLKNDEECGVKLGKLSDLKDMKLEGGSSGWLQVGIASTTEMTTTP